VTTVKFFDPDYIPDGKFTYSVIVARYGGRWMFVRHHDRATWEIAGGHIEENETPSNTASRELTEETGAMEFDLVCVATYSVEKDGHTGYGRLFFAKIKIQGTLEDNSEIAETILMDTLPENLTYPDIQPHLFKKVTEFLKSRERIL